MDERHQDDCARSIVADGGTCWFVDMIAGTFASIRLARLKVGWTEAWRPTLTTQ
jgi:hypothetical protein